MINNQSILDITRLISGKDGQLFITTRNVSQLFLAEVDTFQAQFNPSNTDVQPVGSYLSYAVPISYTVTLTMSELVVRDDITLKVLFEDLKEGYNPSFDFQGKMRRRDGGMARQIFRYCIPDGTIDLMNLTPGDVIKRQWSFRVNSIPEMLEYFTYQN